MVLDESSELFQQLAAPLAGDPVGEDPASLEVFDLLEAELAKADAIDKQKVEWDRVVSWSTDLLSQHTKDLRIAAYLSYGLYEVDAYQGLELGLKVFSALVKSELWEEIYPRRRKRQGKARAASLLWLVARLEKVLDSLEMNEDTQHEAFKAAYQAFDDCEAALANRLEDDAPSVFQFKDKFKRLSAEAEHWIEEKKKQAEQDLESEVVEEPETEVNESSASASEDVAVSRPPPKPKAPVAKPVSIAEDGLDKTLSSVGKSLDDIANYHKTSNPFDANAFYFARLAKWLQVQAIPPAGIIPPIPQAQQLQRFKDLEQQKDYQTLANEAEASFRAGAIFCLSLHRFVYAALMGLNQTAAAQVVLAATKDFSSRFPDIFEGQFQDGSPFVDAQTALWIEQDSGATSSADAPGESQADEIDELFKEAQKLLASGSQDEAIKLLEDALKTSSQMKSKLKLQYLIGKLFSQLDRHSVAISLFETTAESMKTCSAFDYDENLSQNLSILLLKCYSKIKMTQELSEEQLTKIRHLQYEVFSRNPSLALEINEI